MKKTALLLGSTLGLGLPALGADSATEELRQTIKAQQETLKTLEIRLAETEKRLEQTADAVDSAGSGKSATTIGGYGELHYNHLTNDETGESAKKEFDFHRFVLFFGHEFNEKTRFFSEVELEHALAGEGKPGEVELEQAYIEHDINDTFTAKAGVFLVPVGILNETHEPPTFYGVERNPVEKNIIPATWWEGGAALTIKPMPGLAIDTAISSGLNVDPAEYKIRGGRQKVANAVGEDLAYTLRAKYTAIQGLELAATAQYQTDITQNNELSTEKAPATLLSAHAIYSIGGFGVRALYAMWDIEGQDAEDLGRDKQNGYYLEPSYRFNDQVGVFARYSAYDTEAGDNEDSKVTYVNTGINYYLHENVVFKADYEVQGGTKDISGFNLGVGYQF